MPLYSCSERKSSLFSNEQSSLYITYSKKEIVIKSSRGDAEHFFLKDGEYFDSSDSTLFFSVVRDTILNVTNSGIDYKIIVEKGEDGQFKTSSYLVNDSGCLYFLISYCYDSNYHISKVVKCDNVIHQ